MTSTTTASPPAFDGAVLIDVDYYNDHHRDLLLKSRARRNLEDAGIPGRMSISRTDFLTYYLFYKKRPGAPGYSSYSDLSTRVESALHELDGMVEYANGSVCAVSLENSNAGTTERVGEAIGLSVVSMIHGLHEADWSRIPVTNKRKTLDFEYASDGNLLLRTEAKGAVLEDNRLRTGLAKKIEHIDQKKADDRGAGAGAILYGTIAVLNAQRNDPAKCWLVDPPAAALEDPGRFRLLARQRAIADMVAFVGRRSHLVTALRTRIAALESIREMSELDGVPLSVGSGKPMQIAAFDPREPWFANKTKVVDGPATGQVVQLNNRELFFVGIRNELPSMAASQSFDVIRQYGYLPAIVKKEVECVVSVSRLKNEFDFGGAGVDLRVRGKLVRFRLAGELHYSRGGLVFGILPLDGESARSML